MDPAILAIPAAIAASCAFMLPVATPPNAIVYGSGMLPIWHMVRSGMVLNLAGIVIITLLSHWLVGFIILINDKHAVLQYLKDLEKHVDGRSTNGQQFPLS